jgi:hypothetical protein
LLQISLSYTAAFMAFFATSQVGGLGARTASGYDFISRSPWNGA